MTVIKLSYASFVASVPFCGVIPTISWFLWVTKWVVSFQCLW